MVLVAVSASSAVLADERPSDPYVAPMWPMRLTVPRVERGPGGGGVVPAQVNVTSTGMNVVGDAANEPSIAVDPVDPRRIAVGWRQFDTITSNFRQAGRAHSRDGGRTWIASPVLEPGVFRSDPVLRADADGRMYYLSLKVDSTFTCQVFRSLDGGATYPAVFPAQGGDKAWLAIDLNAGAPSRGAMYQHWTQTMSRSFDLGATWAAPFGNVPIFGQNVVGPDSALSIVGIVGNGFPVQYTRSTNVSNPLATPTLTTINLPFAAGQRGFLNGSPSPGGLLGQICVDVDRSTGPRRGWIYVMAPVGPDVGSSDPLDVMFTRSADNGQTWSAPVRVNTSVRQAGDWQWFAAMSVAPNGRIDAVWNDTRETLSFVSRLYTSSSFDGGTTWTQDAPIGQAFNPTLGYPNQNKIGDYSDMQSDELGANVVVAATFNGEQDVWFYRIGPRICPGDFNRDGAVSVQDIFDFLAAYFAGDIRADRSRDFVVSVQDIFEFLGLWFGVCS